MFLGPLLNAAAVKKYEHAVRLGKREGRLIYGGRALNDSEMAHGFFVEPAIVDKLTHGSLMFQEEYFAPVLAVAKVRSLGEAIRRANDSEYGLTAGIFTADKGEQ